MYLEKPCRNGRPLPIKYSSCAMDQVSQHGSVNVVLFGQSHSLKATHV